MNVCVNVVEQLDNLPAEFFFLPGLIPLSGLITKHKLIYRGINCGCENLFLRL